MKKESLPAERPAEKEIRAATSTSHFMPKKKK
jgi:hypothetical protein